MTKIPQIAWVPQEGGYMTVGHVDVDEDFARGRGLLAGQAKKRSRKKSKKSKLRKAIKNLLRALKEHDV